MITFFSLFAKHDLGKNHIEIESNHNGSFSCVLFSTIQWRIVPGHFISVSRPSVRSSESCLFHWKYPNPRIEHKGSLDLDVQINDTNPQERLGLIYNDLTRVIGKKCLVGSVDL